MGARGLPDLEILQGGCVFTPDITTIHPQHELIQNITEKMNSFSTRSSSTQPSQTLYIQNLDDKIKKSDLQRLLYQLFSIHGKVIDVVVKKGKMRGQAFVVFSDFQGATQAMRQLDGTGFLDRDLKISYGKNKSYATIRQLAGDEVLYHVKLGLKDPNTLQDKTSKNSGKLRVSGAQAAQMEKKKAEEFTTKKRLQGSMSDEENEQEEEEEEDGDDGGTDEQTKNNSSSKKKKMKTSHPNDNSNANANQADKDGQQGNGDNDDDEEAMEEDSDSEQPVDSAAAAAVKAAGSAPILSGEDPNPVLFLEGLPAEVTDDMMAVLFQQYPGFQSVRLVPGRTGIAFVQYDTATQSDMAKAALDGFQLAPGVIMKVSFAHRG